MALFATALAASACVGNGLQGGLGAVTTPAPAPPNDGNTLAVVGNPNDPNFEALTPGQYGSKVKALLTGLPLTADEYTQLTADPKALPAMVDAWMATPQWQKIMLDYFRKVFQTGTDNFFDYANLFVRIYQINQDWDWFGWHTWYDIIDSMQDVFPRTALQLVNENAPFTQVLTTQRYMMNTPMMAMAAYLDAVPQDDNAADVMAGYWMGTTFADKSYVRQPSRVIDANASMDPNSPDFMNWYDATYNPNSTYNLAWCTEPLNVDPNGVVTGGGSTMKMGKTYTAQMNMIQLFGGRRGCTPWQIPGASKGRAGVFTDGDWSTWKWVTTRHPAAGETPTVFTNVPQMRARSELVLNGDQSGFITTPGFLESWMTNKSNADRVLVNQALIIGLDFTFAPQNTAPSPNSGDPNQHAAPGTVCFGCHASLDPAVALFRQSYSLSHRWQASRPASVPATGTFVVPGAPAVNGSGVATLGAAMAAHPLFAKGWVQKMCRFANGAPCLDTDPEFQRIVIAFGSSNFNFRTLLRELVLSPMVTSATYSPTAAALHAKASIARRDQLCAALEARLQWPDACQLRVHNMYGSADADGDTFGKNVRALGQTVADSTFTRGQIEPAMPTQPDLFYVLSSDNLCLLLSQQVVDGKAGTALGTHYPATSRWTSSDPNGAIADFVQEIMGVPTPDPRSGALQGVLQQHYAAAIAANAGASDALRSTFISACTAGTAIGRGL